MSVALLAGPSFIYYDPVIAGDFCIIRLGSLWAQVAFEMFYLLLVGCMVSCFGVAVCVGIRRFHSQHPRSYTLGQNPSIVH